MDKVTKGFVIAACSVVIATPIVLHQREKAEAVRDVEELEFPRKYLRIRPCVKRAMELFPDGLTQDAFQRRCIDSTKPVWEVE